MLNVGSFIWGVLVPGTVTGVGLVVAARWRRGARPLGFGALCAAVAFLLGYTGLFGLPPLPFGARTLPALDWLIWVATLAGALLFFDVRSGLARAILRATVGGGMLFAILQAMLRHHWSGPASVLWPGALALGLLGLCLLVLALERRGAAVDAPGTLMVCATGLALAAGLSGSAKIAQTVGIRCACTGAIVILALRPARLRLRLASADLVFFVVTLYALGLCAVFYSDLPALDGLLIASGPLAALALDCTRLRDASPGRRTLVRILAVSIPVALAVARAAWAFDAGSGPGDYGDYDY